MKKIILAAVLFVSGLAQAQIAVFDGDTQLVNGETYPYSVLGEPAKMHFLVQNDTDATIYVKLKMLESNNPDGESVQFCYGGVCFDSAPVGRMAPNGGHTSATTIVAGGNNLGFDGYFYNQYAGTGQAVNYTMGLVHIDTAGNQVGDPIITFTYKYDPTAATTDFNALERMGIVVNNTIVKSTLDLTANQNAKLQIVNINGQIIKTIAVANGSQSIDLSSAATGVYFARFTTEDNKTAQVKIVKN
ncbi:T9SS type A sorting domain-containing protein [Flavobacterium hauense]